MYAFGIGKPVENFGLGGVAVVVSQPSGGGGGVRFRYTTPDKVDDLVEQIKREDEELLAVIVAMIETRIL